MFPQRMFPQTLFPSRMFPKVGATAVTVARTGGGWAQPTYIRKTEKRDPVIAELNKLANELPEKAEAVQEVARIEQRKAFIDSTPDFSGNVKALNQLNLEIAKFRIELEKALKAVREEEEEEDLIVLLASL